MSGEIQKANPQQMQTTPVSLTQTGDHNTQVGYVGNYDDSTHTMVFASNREEKYGPDDIDSSIEFNNSCYQLFVMDDEKYRGPSFVVKKEVALTESTPEDLRTLCGSFSQEAIDRIKTYPAIFANRNHQYKMTDADHNAYFGYVIEVDVLEEGMRISYVPLQHFPQQLMNENLDAFGLDSSWGVNELDNVHWAIKKVNLIETLKNLGLRILSF